MKTDLTSALLAAVELSDMRRQGFVTLKKKLEGFDPATGDARVLYQHSVLIWGPNLSDGEIAILQPLIEQKLGVSADDLRHDLQEKRKTLDAVRRKELDAENLCQELARLSSVQYDRRREEVSEDLGIRVSTLDAVVAKLRGTPSDETSGTAVTFDDPDPWPESVSGDALLEEIAKTFARFVVLPSHGADVLTLWTLHSYTHEAAAVSPLLALTSPEKRCGKTSVLGLLSGLACRALSASNISPSAFFRVTEKFHPTLLIDEADTFLKENEEARGIVNSGHTRATAFVIRNVSIGDDFDPRRFCTWGPKSIALIGTLHPTLGDRSITISMRRRRKDEPVERLRLDVLTDDLQSLRRKCLRWASDHLNDLKKCDPAIPSELHDRAADNWRPLLAIADLAGGPWPQRAREAALALSNGEDRTEAAGVLLLSDLRDLFQEKQADRLTSAEIVERLITLEDRPWPEWYHGKPLTVRQLARLLRPFGVAPQTVRFGSQTAKGYELVTLQDSFSRYPPPFSSVTPSQVNDDRGFSDFRSVTGEKDVTDEKLTKPLSIKGCDVVTDKKGGMGERGGTLPLLEEENEA